MYKKIQKKQLSINSCIKRFNYTKKTLKNRIENLWKVTMIFDFLEAACAKWTIKMPHGLVFV